MRKPTNHPRSLPRRAFLKGVGVTMSLPWLQSLAERTSVALAEGAPVAAAGPKRLAVFFMGNGVNPDHWWAKGEGASLELGKTLAPLEPFKTKLNLVSGLFNKTSTGHGIHPPMTGNLLTGVPISKGAVIHSGISMDQLIAKKTGQETPQASIVLACEQPMTGYHETNYSNSYGSHISWENADSPVPNEIYPALAFDSLFENRGNLRNLSVLDRVRDRAKKLSSQVSSADRAKLDEYYTSVREIETKVERMRADMTKAEERARDKGAPVFTMMRPDNGLPEDFREHARLMCDIMALAFQTDRTRVASLILARDLSSLYYPFLDVRDAHHTASHSDTSDGYHRIVNFHVSQVAYLAQKLSEMREGESTVLDNSCLMFISNMYSGTHHDNSKVPVLTVGGLGGAIKTGRSLDYQKAGDDGRKLCSLYLSLMDAMDVKVEQFGDADSRLANF